MRAILKANRAEAEARLLQARLYMNAIANAASGTSSPDAPSTVYARQLPLSTVVTPTPIGDRPVKAAALFNKHEICKRGCSELVCKVLEIPWEDANHLMGNNPPEITDWNQVTAGAIVGWTKSGGSGHVSVYVKDGESTFIDVHEPADDAQPRRLDSYGASLKMYLSRRFGS